MGVGGGGALDIHWCTNLRRFIYDHLIYFTAALSMDLQLIGPELVVELGVEIKHEIQTLNPTYIIVNITVLISMPALEGGGGGHFKLVGGGGGGEGTCPWCPPASTTYVIEFTDLFLLHNYGTTITVSGCHGALFVCMCLTTTPSLLQPTSRSDPALNS